MCPDVLLTSIGSLGTVPRFQRYYGALRLPAARPASLRRLRSAVTACARHSLPRHRAPVPEPGGLGFGPPYGRSLSGDDRISHVPRESPLPACPALRPRRGLTYWRNIRSAALTGGPSANSNASALATGISELDHAAYWLAVYASQQELPPYHARLASGRLPTYRTGFHTRQRFQSKVSVSLPYITSSLAELRGAMSFAFCLVFLRPSLSFLHETKFLLSAAEGL